MGLGSWFKKKLIAWEIREVYKALRKYPLMISVIISGVAAVLIAFGQVDIADWFLKVSEGYGETGFNQNQFIVLLVGLIQLLSALMKFFADRKKAKRLRNLGIKDRRG